MGQAHRLYWRKVPDLSISRSYADGPAALHQSGQLCPREVVIRSIRCPGNNTPESLMVQPKGRWPRQPRHNTWGSGITCASHCAGGLSPFVQRRMRGAKYVRLDGLIVLAALDIALNSV